MCKRIPNAAHKNGTEQIFERDERVVNSKEHRRKFEVNEKHDYTEIDERVWNSQIVGFLVNYEQNRGCHGRLGGTVKGQQTSQNRQ